MKKLVLLLGAIMAYTTVASAQRGLAWAWIRVSGTTPSVGSGYTYNSGVGAITVVRNSTGVYRVRFAGLGMTGGVVHVTAYGGNHYCNSEGWFTAGTTLDAGVSCFNPSGGAADGSFTVRFYRESRASTAWSGGYVWADQKSASSYSPSAEYQWNSKGFTNTITSPSIGRYVVSFPGLGPLPNGGSVMVTGYQSTARCKPTSWGGASTVTVYVSCDSPAGNAVDSEFTVSFVTDTGFGVSQGQQQFRGGFAWSNRHSSVYLPNLFYQYGSVGGVIHGRRIATGEYEADFPGLNPVNSTAHVSAYGGTGYCNTGFWQDGPNFGTTVRVRCYSAAGVAQDASFTVNYLTSEQATSALPTAPGPANAKAWVWSDNPAGTVNPNSLYQYNSSGASNSVTRLGAGQYRADLPGLGTLRGMVHVNAYSTSRYCKAAAWGPNGTTQEVYVHCFDPAGNLADSVFNVLFYRENRTASIWSSGHARAHLPIVSSAYSPVSLNSWNGMGQPVTISRTATGRYLATFDGFTGSPNSGSVLVTPYGVTPARCKVQNWSTTSVSIGCHQPDGTPADSEFGVSFFNDVLFGAPSSATAHPGGYFWAHDRTSATYQPEAAYRFNSTGGGYLATRSGAGTYQASFTGLKAYGASIAMVTAYGATAPASTFCAPTLWNPAGGSPGTSISVSCKDGTGAAVDSEYTVLYLTTPLSPSSLTSSSGGGQSAQVNSPFPSPLRASAADANIPLANVPVNFTAPGGGASASLSASTAVTNSSGIAQINATANAVAGAYNVSATVTGLSPAQFSLTNTLPGGLVAPTILTPANGFTVTNTIINFSWTQIPAATKYELRVIEAGTPQQFRVELLGSASTSAIYTFPSGSYRAEVRACGPLGCGPAGISNFTVNGGAVSSAAPGGVGCAIVNDAGQNRLDCNWSAVSGAHFYFVNVVQPGAGPGGGALTVAGRQVGTNSISILVPNGSATVIVRACTGDGCGPFSSGVPVNPSFGNPTVPLLGEPFGGSSVDAGSNAPNVTFSWNRVAGDNGSNFLYRLYVQDFARNSSALDILTTNNFFGAYFNPGTRYDALVQAIPVGGGTPRQGPPSAFLTRGRVPRSPVSTGPTFGSPVSRDALGQVAVSWTPLVNNDGTVSTRNYQYFFSGPTQSGGITTATTVPLNLAPGAWQGTMRACTTGTSCTESSPAGWGPWNNEPGSEGGIASFTVQ